MVTEVAVVAIVAQVSIVAKNKCRSFGNLADCVYFDRDI